MHRNILKEQYYSALNPNQVYQLPFQIIEPKKMPLKQQKNALYKKSQSKSIQRKKYLSVVSNKLKSKKNIMNSSRNKKKLPYKKSNSVSLGGQKRNSYSAINTQYSYRSSLCKSCSHSVQENNFYKALPLRQQLPPVQIMANKPEVICHPVSYITQQPCQIPLKRIVFHKLNLAAVQPHNVVYNSILGQGRFNSNPTSIDLKRRAQSIEKKFVPHRRNISTGRIYSTNQVNSNGPNIQRKFSQMKQILLTNQNTDFFTPRFDKHQSNKEVNKQKKQRKNAGFIRSSSAKKYEQLNSEEQITMSQLSFKDKEPKKTSSFNYNTQNKRTLIQQTSLYNIPHTSGKIELDECFEKMNSLKKQISDLQHLLKDRLNIAESRSKTLSHCSSAKSFAGNKKNTYQNQLYGSFQVYQPGNTVSGLVSKISLNNGLMRNSCTSTLMNRLNSGSSQMSNISPTYNKLSINNNSSSLEANMKMASSIYSSNSSVVKRQQVQHGQGNQVISQQSQVLTQYNRIASNFSKYTNNRHNQNLTIDQLCRLKCPSTQIEKQIIHEINSKHNLRRNDSVNKRITNQQNIIDVRKMTLNKKSIGTSGFNIGANNSNDVISQVSMLYSSTNNNLNGQYSYLNHHQSNGPVGRQFGGHVNYLR